MPKVESPQGNIDPVAAYYYEDVRLHYCPLSPEVEAGIVDRLDFFRTQMILRLNEWPEINEWLRQRFDMLKGRAGGSVAKMSEDYDSKKTGLNQTLTQGITDRIEREDFLGCNFKFDLYEEAYKDVKREDSGIEEYLRIIREEEHKLIYSVLKMIRRIAKQYGSEIYGIDEKDLIQAGNEALLKTVRLYKAGHCRFYTFAYWKIKSAVQQYIMQNSRLVYLPKHKVSNVLLVLQASNCVEENLRHDLGILTRECRRIGNRPISESEVEEALVHLSGHTLTIDSPLQSNEGRAQRPKTLSDSLSDDNIDIEGTVNQARVLGLTEDVLLGTLSQMEAAVIYFRYLDPEYVPKRKTTERPYGDIPALFRAYRLDPSIFPSKSREHIRGIERRALKKLKMNSIWFWKRYRDEVMAKFLTAQEIGTVFAMAIEPKTRGEDRLTWRETGHLLNRTPHEIMATWRSALSKLRQHAPDIGEWISV